MISEDRLRELWGQKYYKTGLTLKNFRDLVQDLLENTLREDNNRIIIENTSIESWGRCETFGCNKEAIGSFQIAPGTRLKLCGVCSNEG